MKNLKKSKKEAKHLIYRIERNKKISSLEWGYFALSLSSKYTRKEKEVFLERSDFYQKILLK